MVSVNLAVRNSTLIDNSRIARAIVARSQQRLLQTKTKKTKQNKKRKKQTNKTKQKKKNKRRSDPSAETLTFKVWPLTSTGTNETGQYHIGAKMES